MPIAKQLTIILENKSGALAKICTELASKGINIEAISILETIDAGLIRMVVSDADRAKKMFEGFGHNVVETDVLTVEMTDKPGALADVTRQLYKSSINIEYAYASMAHNNAKSVGIFWVSDPKRAAEILEA